MKHVVTVGKVGKGYSAIMNIEFLHVTLYDYVRNFKNNTVQLISWHTQTSSEAFRMMQTICEVQHMQAPVMLYMCKSTYLAKCMYMPGVNLQNAADSSPE